MNTCGTVAGPSTDVRPILALIGNSFDEYQRCLTRLFAAKADVAGYRLLTLTGGSLHDCGTATPSSWAAVGTRLGGSAIHTLAEDMDAAGYIVVPGSIGRDVGLEAVEAFVQRFGGRPSVCIGMPAAGIASVAGDDEPTMLALVRHMTADPARRRFVFLRGHRGCYESDWRERLFRQVLAERGLPVDERLFLDTFFNPSEAYCRIIALLRDGVRFDGVVAANDTIGAGAVRALDRFGIRVPHDVIVSGFDDHEESRLCTPPLTTVRLPLEPQVDAAFAALLAQLDADTPDGAPPARHVVVPCRLLLRASSGARAGLDGTACLPGADRAAQATRSLGDTFGTELERTAPPAHVDMERFVALLGRALTGEVPELQKKLVNTLRPASGAPVAIGWWRELQGTLDRVVQHGVGTDMERTGAANLALIQGTISDTLWAEMRQRQSEDAIVQELLERLQLALGRCTSHAALCELLHDGLERLELDTACLALYADEPCGAPGASATIAMARVRGRRYEVRREPFASRHLAPPALLETLGSDPLVLSPLHAGELHYGYLLHGIGAPEALSIPALAQSIANTLQSCRLIASLEHHAHRMHAANQQLARAAGTDCLTGLRNRSGFLEAFERRLEDASRNGRELTLLYFDLDGFKAVNDTHGHAAGDRLLQTVAERVRARLRSGDTVARLGGDEFTVTLDGAHGRAGAVRVAQALLDELSRPMDVDGARVDVSASIGIARFPADGTRSELLIHHADSAMYRAKSEGRNRYAWYCSSIPDAGQEPLGVASAPPEMTGTDTA